MTARTEVDVFICYRRSDSEFAAHRLRDQLSAKFKVFLDDGSIPPAEHFPSQISDSLHEAKVCIVLIGDRWIDSAPRLVDHDDWVRQEVEHALGSQTTRVVPLLLDAKMPNRESLPSSLHKLTELQAVATTSRNFADVVSRLMKGDLRKWIKQVKRERNPPAGAPLYVQAVALFFLEAIVPVVFVVGAIFFIWRALPSREDFPNILELLSGIVVCADSKGVENNPRCQDWLDEQVGREFERRISEAGAESDFAIELILDRALYLVSRDRIGQADSMFTRAIAILRARKGEQDADGIALVTAIRELLCVQPCNKASPKWRSKDEIAAAFKTLDGDPNIAAILRRLSPSQVGTSPP